MLEPSACCWMNAGNRSKHWSAPYPPLDQCPRLDGAGLPERRAVAEVVQGGGGQGGVIGHQQAGVVVGHQFGDTAGDGAHDRHHTCDDGFEQGNRQTIKLRYEQDRLTALEERLDLRRSNASV